MVKITKETADLWASIKKHYCGCIPDIPVGCEAEGFGVVGPGAIWLDACGRVRTDPPGHPNPRIILRKSAPPPPPPPVLSATITTDEVYPYGYEVPAGYKVLGFGRKDEFPGATHFIGDVQGALGRWAEPLYWLPKSPRRILLEKL